MTKREQLAILRKGVDAWNAWRERNPSVDINLRKANLMGANLSGAYLKYVDLSSANLRGADLSYADLSLTILRGVDLRETYLSNANCNGADLSFADLSGAKFTRCVLNRAIFRNAQVNNSKFLRVDLGEPEGLEEVEHGGPSDVDLKTIRMSLGKIPNKFLRGCGLSDLDIEYAKLANPGLDANEVLDISYRIHDLYRGGKAIYRSCFISYSNKDEEFAKRIHENLQDKGVRCWFAPEDMMIGDRIRIKIDQEIRLRDKLLVILSENSISSTWVGDEVESALDEEKASGRTILFPIRLDEAVMEAQMDWAAMIKRRRHIGDFSKWADEREYKKAFERLLKGLKAGGIKTG